jgi:AcrR family transcriptional regulator
VTNRRRTQAERSADARNALVAAARTLFATHGYTEVALETIVQAAGLTRGALYHHFADKSELFTAVFERVDSEVNQRMGQAMAAADPDDPLAVLRLGANMWLDVAVDPEIQRIVVVDAPAVLGWDPPG